MKTKRFTWLLMGALLCGLSLSVTSCKDDDDDKNTSEQRNEDASPLDTEEAQTAWRWLCAMTDAESLTTDWAKKTYEPTIGVPSENNANTRIVVVSDLDEAKTKFGSLADVTPSQLGSELTVNQSGVGKLTWTPSPAGAQNLAEVAVDTKLIPHLQKIVYCTEDQVGVNGLFSNNITGTAYYRFGDVIERDGFYWVCVRPCHEVSDKGKSHWINIFNTGITGKKIPDQYIYKDYDKKYNNHTIMLPTQLKYNREHLHNLGNLIWALLHPGAYHSTVGEDPKTSKGLGQFPYQYHNETFLKNVVRYWKNTMVDGHDLWSVLFNTSYEELQSLADKKASLCFYYKGYSWVFGSSGTLWCYKQSKYEPTEKGSESGDKISWPMKEKGFDIRTYAFDPEADQTVGHPQVDDNDNYYWVVRYATGEELTKAAGEGTLTPTSGIPGYKDIYRYYKEKNVPAGTFWEKAQTADQEYENFDKDAQVGHVLGLDNHLYKNRNIATDASGRGVAVVAYVGEAGNEKVDIDSDSPILAVGTETIMARDGMIWGNLHNEYQTSYPYRAMGMNANKDDLINQLNGIGCTFQTARRFVDSACGYEAWCYMEKTLNGAKWVENEGLAHTRWFVPSTGQWILVMKGLNVYNPNYEGSMAIKAFYNLLHNAGFTNIHASAWTDVGVRDMFQKGVWTSTEADEDHAYVFRIAQYEGNLKCFIFEPRPKDELHVAFPFIAIGAEAKGELQDDL